MSRAPRLLSLAAIAALAVAACGGTATASVTPTETPSGAPATASPAAEPSVTAPSEAPVSQAPASASTGEGPDLEGATTALDSIRKYAIAMTISGMMPTASGASAITMNGVVDQDADAYEFEMSGFQGLGAPGSAIKFIVIGSDAWVDLLGTGSYMKQPGGGGAFDQMKTALSPSTLLGQFPTSGYELLKVADEEKNGIATTHYHADAAQNPQLVASIGADGVMDFWIAADGGYLVSMNMSGTMDAQGTGTPAPVEMSIDLSRVNDPSISIEAPN